MTKKILSKDIVSIFEYIRTTLGEEIPNVMVDEYAYIVAVLHSENSLAYQSLSSIVMESTLNDMKDMFKSRLRHNECNDNTCDASPLIAFDEYINDCNDICESCGASKITSSMMLLSIIKKHEDISKLFRDYSVTYSQLINSIKNHTPTTTSIVKVPKKTPKKRTEVLNIAQPIKVIEKTSQYNGEIDRNLINLSKLASLGKIPTVINYERYYTSIFNILSKKNRNNVIICGNSGVGKTATAKNIANIIIEKKCNAAFHSKTLVEMDFSKLVIGTPYKGAFEQKFYSIFEEAKSNGNYIFFIDNIHNLLNGNTKYAETDIESLLDTLFNEPSIQVVCTTTPKSLSSILSKSIIGKYLQEVRIEEPTIDEAVNILNKSKEQYETYHYVAFDDNAINECVKLSQRYITQRSLPDSALDMLDAIGAQVTMNLEENNKIKELKEKLSDIIDEINYIKSSSETKEYVRIDELTKSQIAIKSQIGILEKEEMLSKSSTLISKNDVCKFFSNKFDVSLEDLTQTEKNRLKGLSDRIKDVVVGQDEAVNEVCRAVKRQRVGLGENKRPVVLMFLGSTGTGKTYLAKQLAKEVYGDEKYLVRMDMSEYSDKTSVNKINGSNPGYVGYENDTLLVKALKNKKRFVLLLDEFEKSDEEVHNIFLQIFDEGRFTDNHGEEYSLNDVIIIMTSNVGVAEASSRGRAIGFDNEECDYSKSIIEKELKRKFKPEFINRIQKIVYFNNLNDSNLRSIVEKEVSKINEKVENLGYHLSDTILKTSMIDRIHKDVLSKKEYGARPIVNEVQRQIEDKIVDYMIENDVEEGHTFTYDELSLLD